MTRPSPSPPSLTRLPARLAAGLVLAIILDTAVQTFWKRAALTLPPLTVDHPLKAAAELWRHPLFLAVGLLIGLQMFNWLKVLDDADVSYALPITALSYVSVAGVSAIWLHEAMTPGRAVGVILILAGVFLVSRTPASTVAAKADA